MRRANAAELRAEVRVAEVSQAVADRPGGGDGGEALLHVAAVLLEVLGDEALQQGTLLGVEVAAGDEVLGQGPDLVASPGLEGGHELDVVDQAVLKGEQSEEQ